VAANPAASDLQRAGEQALADDGVDAPIAVDHLRHAEIDTVLSVAGT
jgi:hypothetical protein